MGVFKKVLLILLTLLCIPGVLEVVESVIVRKRTWKPLEDRLNDIRNAVNNGVLNAGELAQKVGLKRSTLRNYLSLLEIHLPRKPRAYLRNNDCVDKIRNAVNDGAKSIDDIVTLTGIKQPMMIVELAENAGIELPVDVDSLVRSGTSVREIKEAIGVDVVNETVRQYIVRTGKYEVWKKAAKTSRVSQKVMRKERRNALRDILFCVNSRLLQLVDEEDRWAYQTAMEYRSSYEVERTKGLRSFDTILAFFKRYQTARDSGVRLSLAELAEGLLCAPNQAMDVLDRVGLHSLYWEQKNALSKDQERAIKRSFKLDMNASDIAYFIGAPPQNVYNAFKRDDAETARRIFLTQIQGEKLTYRLASQIYEAKDLRFTPSEISELFDTSPEIVEYALENRTNISYKIMHALRKLYPKREITRPYIKP